LFKAAKFLRHGVEHFGRVRLPLEPLDIHWPTESGRSDLSQSPPRAMNGSASICIRADGGRVPLAPILRRPSRSFTLTGVGEFALLSVLGKGVSEGLGRRRSARSNRHPGRYRPVSAQVDRSRSGSGNMGRSASAIRPISSRLIVRPVVLDLLDVDDSERLCLSRRGSARVSRQRVVKTQIFSCSARAGPESG